MRTLIASFILTLLLAISTFGQERQSITVGNATAARGQKVTGTIEVPAGVDAGLSIPVAIINGVRSGPVLALVAGSHGTEYTSIIALEKLIAMLDPGVVAGTVIIVPLINTPSFEQKVPHVNPVDKKSMNRFYPGKIDGTQTERASYLITKQVVEQCDHLIDLHGGDLDESLRPYSYWTKTGNEKQDQISRDMVLAFGLDHIIISTDRPKDPQASRYLENTATTRGKPSITAEAGHAGTVETDDLNALINGCLNVMRYLSMLPGKPEMVEHPVWIDKVVTLASEQTGIFYPAVKRGTYVEQGMKVGYVTDYVGKVIFEARAPVAGLVLYVCAVPSMTKGATIANIGVITKQTDVKSKTQIVLLGTGTPNADPDRSGPAVAIVVNETPYLIDFGPGVVRRAAAAYRMGVKALAMPKLTKAFVTHLHSDHTVGYPDLIFTPWVLEREQPLEVFGPKGIEAMTKHILEAYREDIHIRVDGLEPANETGYKVRVTEIKPGLVYSDRNVKVTAFLVKHGSWPQAYGYRFDTPDRSIVISGDTAPSASVIENCNGCDVLIHEVYSQAGFATRTPVWQKYHSSFHTSSRELGEIATKAHPGLLILYHQLYWGTSDEQLVDEVRQFYKGRVVSGSDLAVY